MAVIPIVESGAYFIHAVAGLIPFNPTAGETVYVGCDIRASGISLAHVEQAMAGHETRQAIPIQTVRQLDAATTLSLTCEEFERAPGTSVDVGFGTSLVAIKVGSVQRAEFNGV